MFLHESKRKRETRKNLQNIYTKLYYVLYSKYYRLKKLHNNKNTTKSCITSFAHMTIDISGHRPVNMDLNKKGHASIMR